MDSNFAPKKSNVVGVVIGLVVFVGILYLGARAVGTGLKDAKS